MTIKVFIHSRKSETIEIDRMNFCEIQTYLNKKFGLKGWLGYEVLK